MRFFSTKYFSLFLLLSSLSAGAKVGRFDRDDTRQACPAPSANFCSINANCVKAGTLITTGAVTLEGPVHITDTTPSIDCANGALVVDGGLGVGGDLNVCGSATIDQNLTVFEQVSNRIGAEYTIGVDFPTIQAGIDLCNSGLKPDSASNADPLPIGAKNVTLNIPAGTYHETLFIDTDFGTPWINDPGTDLEFLQGRGLRLIGDTRPIAAMTYMNGGLVRADESFFPTLGALNSVVTLTNAGNTITVTIAPGPQPDFAAAGVVPGDVIIVSDNDGIFYERNVVSVSGNSVTYDGAPATISGRGAALTFCPNVHIVSNDPDVIIWIASGQVEMVGIWTSADPLLATDSYGIFVDGSGRLSYSGLLCDVRNQPDFPAGLQTFGGGSTLGSVADGVIFGIVTVLGGSLIPDSVSAMYGGEVYVMAAAGQPASCVNPHNNSSFDMRSLQMNGANRSCDGLRGVTESQTEYLVDIREVFWAFNCNNGLFLNPGSTCTFRRLLMADDCTTGVNISAGTVINFGTGTPFGITPTINNCTTAIKADLNGNFDTSRPLIISNSTNGVVLTGASKFVSKNPVTFVATTTQFTYDAGSLIQNGTADSRFALELPGPFANDAAAAAGGVPLFGLYRLTGVPQTVAVRTV